MISILSSVILIAAGFTQLFSATGSKEVAMAALISAGLFQVALAITSSRKARNLTELGALEAEHAADVSLLKAGHPFFGGDQQHFRNRAARIGALRGQLGYIPSPGSFSIIDYQAKIARGDL